ncbi:unnamed protein product [Rotaria sordida]|uniref:Uncharacterized protein n=1 Tax=Rotaria sordida TaxID=392033 RepID=A0A814PE62_9BILA|nr:unnamed protein product [Rotaria sordida]
MPICRFFLLLVCIRSTTLRLNKISLFELHKKCQTATIGPKDYLAVSMIGVHVAMDVGVPHVYSVQMLKS